jgi:hypothetical protein
MKRYKREFTEADDNVGSIIKTVIDTNWSGSNEDQLKILELMKGIATSDDPKSNKFMKALDDAISKMNPDDYK